MNPGSSRDIVIETNNNNNAAKKPEQQNFIGFKIFLIAITIGVIIFAATMSTLPVIKSAIKHTQPTPAARLMSGDDTDLMKKCSDIRSLAGPTVVTTSGQLMGVEDKLFNKTFYAFKGVPYAEPPVGNLRFKKTVKVEPWSGVLSAQQLRSHCTQLIPSFLLKNLKLLVSKFEEDCLFLNIWTPTLNTSSLKPILLYVHGGGFDIGRVGLYCMITSSTPQLFY